MAKPLTDEQRAFITKFITGKSKGETKKITEAYLDYQRRRDKVAADVDKIENGHPQLNPLRQRLRDAEAKAKAGNFDEAYADLADVKKAAKGVARGYVAGLTPSDLQNEIDRISKKLDSITLGNEQARVGMTRLIAEVGKHKKGSDCATIDEAAAFRRDLTEEEANWRGRIEGFRGLVNDAGAVADGMKVEATLKLMAHRLKVTQEGGSSEQKKAAAALTPKLLALNTRAGVGGKYYTAAGLREALTQQIYGFEDALKPIKDISGLQVTRDAGPALDVESLAALDRKEEERLQIAKDRYLMEMSADNRLGGIRLPKPPKLPGQKDDDAPPPRIQLRRFSAEDVIDDGLDGLDDSQLDASRIAAAGKTTVANLTNFLKAEKPNSDKLFDLTLKSEADLRADLATGMGLSPTGDDWTPQRKALIETLAKAMYDTLLKQSPNRASADKSSVSMNGKTYGKPEKIGAGGLGDIFRYTSDDGEKVIVKELRVDKDADPEELAAKRAEMVKEAQMHRQISGGESGECHPNVLELKGMALGEDGALLMLMDEAEGGDVTALSESVNELVEAGIIPEAARTAMVQTVMQQAVSGLKAVHAQDAMHLDVKGQNFFLDADGQVKIADFGSAETVDDAGKVDTAKSLTTGAFAPPQFGQKMAKQDEVFWLGSMLETMSSSAQQTGTNLKSGGFTGDMAKMRTDHKQTALDRLRNSMLDPDPAKRPTLESVLLSSYLNEVGQSYSQEDTAALMKAVTAYNGKVGREVAKITKDVNWLRASIAQEQPAANANASQVAAAEKKKAGLERELAEFEAQLEAINARDDVAPLLAAVKQASGAFK